MNTRKFLLFLVAALSFTCSFGQVYLPADHTVSNKSYGVAQAAPTDARSYFFDANNFVYRPYQNTAEVLSYLSLPKYRTGQFDIVVNTGGTLNLDGTITGGANNIYYFKNGTADGDLVQKISVVPTLSAVNGIVYDGISQFKLGGTGTENTTIAWGAFNYTHTFNTLAGANGFTVTSTSTAATGSLQKLVFVSLSGANANTGQSTYGVWASNTHTGTSSTNYGLYGEASGATNGNWGVYGTSNATGVGVRGNNTSSGIAIQGTSTSGVGVAGQSVGASLGVWAMSTSGTAFAAQVTSSPTTNAPISVGRFTAETSGTPANNFGGFIERQAKTSDGTTQEIVREFWEWTNVTTASRIGQWRLQVSNNAVLTNRLIVAGNGEITFSGYGAGSVTGTAVKYAAFTSGGKVIEVDAPTVGSAAWDGGFSTTASVSATSYTMVATTPFTLFTGSSPSTWTLPDRATSSKVLIVKNNGSANITVQRAGSDQIFTNSAVTSVTVTPGQSRAFIPLGGFWTSYFDASGAAGSLDAVPTDASTNGVESNGVFDALATKQATLLSGTTIKTINSTSLLGSGDITVAAASHTHAESDITGLVSDLAALAPDAALADGDASPIQNNAVYDEFQTAYTLIGTKAAKSANLSDIASPSTALSNLGGTPLNRSITVYGAAVPTYDFASDRTYYPRPPFYQGIEALGSVIKGQSLGLNFDQMSTASFTAVSGTVYWTAVWLPSPQTLTGIKYWLGTTGSFTGNNFNGFALYTYSGGTLTQVATSANDENIWKGTANAYQTVSFTGTYSAGAGLYFVAYMFSASATTTAPTFGIGASVATGGMQSGDFTNSAKLVATHTGQTALPSTRLMSALTVTTLRPWVGLY